MKLKRDLDRRVPNMNGLDRRVPNMVFSQTFTSSDLNLCSSSSSPKTEVYFLCFLNTWTM
jgi:hypothetical protein